jgi:hypothetical protein
VLLFLLNFECSFESPFQLQKHGFLFAHGTLSALIGDHNSKYSLSLFRDYAQFRDDTTKLNGSVMITNSTWKSQNLFLKGLLEDAIPDEYDPWAKFEESKSRMGPVLKYVFNGQHRLATTKRHIEQFKTIPCMIWTRMHPSLCRWLGTKLNNVVGQQMAVSCLDKCRVFETFENDKYGVFIIIIIDHEMT